MMDHLVPYSIERLVRLCRRWSFRSDCDQLVTDEGVPFTARAYLRVKAQLASWRDAHRSHEDPVFDETMQEFHVSDVAVLWDEYRRLKHLEERVMEALGPPRKRMRWNKRKGEFEEE